MRTIPATGPQPRWGWENISWDLPRVAPSSQPWALRRNPFGIPTTRRATSDHVHTQDFGTQLARLGGGFTLLELLIVITIIGFLVGLTLPHVRGLTRSNVMLAANQQLLDDIALARRRAINGRTVVSMVFMPPVLNDPNVYKFLDVTQQNQILNWQYSAYTMFAERSIGDQPGRPFRRYLSGWRTLPEGVFIAADKFVSSYFFTNATGKTQNVIRFDYKDFPYPTGDNPQTLNLAYIAFNPQGHLIQFDTKGREVLSSDNCIIPLARGSIFLERDPTGAPVWTPAELRETGGNNSRDTNTYNEIEIDAVTGRALIDRKSL